MMGTGRSFTVTELGHTPFPVKVKEMHHSDVGYVVAQIKTLGDVRIGDTIHFGIQPRSRSPAGIRRTQTNGVL